MLLAGGALASSFFACNSLVGIDVPELRQDAGGGADTGTVAVCPSAVRPPERPATEPTGDAGNRDFVVALRTVALKATDVGFDLDRRCTCLGEGPSCVSKADAGETGTCDQPGGRDVATNQFLDSLVVVAKGFSEEDLNAEIAKGNFGLVVKVENYNGAADDRSVRATVYLGSGIAGGGGDAGVDAKADAKGDAKPTDAKDAAESGPDDGGAYDEIEWFVQPASVVDAGGATEPLAFIDDDAFVASGVLVSQRLNRIMVVLPSAVGPFPLQSEQGILTARIVPDGRGSFRLTEGRLGMRIRMESVLDALGRLVVGAVPLCVTPFYPDLKSKMCAFADLTRNPADDPAGTGDCNAMSFGMGFDTTKAVIKGLKAVPLNSAGTCPKDSC